MLNFPGVIKAKFVRQHDLIHGFMEQSMLIAFVPWTRKLQLVENTKTHGDSF
jgi:hypothetical protein